MASDKQDRWFYKPLKDGGPIISVERAREILGKEAEQMSDAQVEQLIFDLDMMAQYSLEQARKQHHKEQTQQLAQLVYDIYQEKSKDMALE